MDDEDAFGLDKFCIVTEAFKIGLLSTIDIEMVRVGRGNYSQAEATPVADLPVLTSVTTQWENPETAMYS